MPIATIATTNLIGSEVTLEGIGIAVPVATTVTLKATTDPESRVPFIRYNLDLLARINDDSLSLTVNGTLLSKTETLRFCNYPVEPEEYIPHPELGYASATVLTGPAVLQGGSFVLPRPVSLNRVVFRNVAFTAPATGVILLYQEFEGRVSSELALVATVPFTPAANTTFEVEPNEGPIILSDGFFYALWGQDSGAGSFSLQTYTCASIFLLNSASGPSGMHPVNASSILDPGSPPATIDPMTGGDLTGAAGADTIPLLRFRTV